MPWNEILTIMISCLFLVLVFTILQDIIRKNLFEFFMTAILINLSINLFIYLIIFSQYLMIFGRVKK